MANDKKTDNEYNCMIVCETAVLYGPVKWKGSLLEKAKWYKYTVGCEGVRIVKILVDEKDI